MEQEIVHIDRLTYGRAGVGRLSCGKTVFVEGAAPGDTLVVEIEKHHPNYSEAVIKEIVEPGQSRVTPPCPYVGVCGGCSWQHIDYQAQLQAKRSGIIDALVRICKMNADKVNNLVADCIPSSREFGYRNKLELATGYFENKGFELGFKKEKSDELVSVDACLLAHSAIQKAPKALRGALRYMQGTTDLRIYRVGVRHSEETGDLEVALWTPPGSFPRGTAAKTIASALDATSIVRVIADPGKQRKIKQVEALLGKGYWEEKIASCGFKTSAPSFFQVNTDGAETMIDAVVGALDLPASATIADLYAGGGTFSVPLAKRYANIVAVEAASSSVKDLRRNADANKVDIEIIGGDSAREIKNLGALDALVVDPPRLGLADGVANNIALAGPSKVAYVSCNPSTWARDVVRLQEVGYVLKSVQPIDLFPQTYHAELVSVFEREDQ